MARSIKLDSEKRQLSSFAEYEESFPSRKRSTLFRNGFVLITGLFATLLLKFSCQLSPSQLYNWKLNDTEDVSEIYLDALKLNLASNWSYAYSRDNQLAGTNLNMVYWAKGMFESFGLPAEIDEYDVYIGYPLNQSLSLLGTGNQSLIYKPSLREDVITEDPTSEIFVPAFLGYANSGNVTASYIYCNYGTKEDFDTLVKAGVDLKEKIAVIRYGGIFRGLKVKFAQDHGMAAVLLYTDPYDDGEVILENGYKAYPKGFARNPSAIQRGSAQFLSYGPGDPSSPGYAIKPGENKSRTDPYDNIPLIPALPISYREVTPILKTLSGHGPKFSHWQKGLIKGFDYSVGPNPYYELNLYNKQEFNISTMHNIMAKIEGENKDDVIIIGNHHDSWVPAAGDPHSGSAVMMEIARGLGALLKLGWKPKRSIWLASWDGEEYGLIGSTEFGEYYSKMLKHKVVAYLNLDVAAIGGNLKLGASPLLYNLLRETGDLLSYPDSDITLYDHFKKVSNDTIHHLGSGSDYTVFLDHLGIPSVDLGFSNSLKNSPVYHYHSIYDSYAWMSKFGDPGYKFHNLMAKYVGLLALNLSENKLLKFRTADYSVQLTNFFNKLDISQEWLDHKLKCSHNIRGSSSNSTTLADLIDQINTNLDDLLVSSTAFDEHLKDLELKLQDWSNLSFFEKIKVTIQVRRANGKLKYFERRFLKSEGLHERPWFKHTVFTSGRYTGYAGQQLPALNEAIEDNDFHRFVGELFYFDNTIRSLK